MPLDTHIAPPEVPMTLAEAIALEEGYYKAGSRARRNNNPGNIEFGEFAQKFGAKEGDPRFAIFSTEVEGFAALKTLLLDNYKGMTLSKAIYKYAPPSENNTPKYIFNLTNWLWLPSTTIIDENIV